jgi:hypothetical protein
MERNNRHFTLCNIQFSRTIRELNDLDILVRMGISFIGWLLNHGRRIPEKQRTDFPVLIAELRKEGSVYLPHPSFFLNSTIKDNLGRC